MSNLYGFTTASKPRVPRFNCKTEEEVGNAPVFEKPFQIVHLPDLEPFWHAPRAKGSEHVRCLASWIGGRNDFENFDRGVAADSEKVILGVSINTRGSSTPTAQEKYTS